MRHRDFIFRKSHWFLGTAIIGLAWVQSMQSRGDIVVSLTDGGGGTTNWSVSGSVDLSGTTPGTINNFTGLDRVELEEEIFAGAGDAFRAGTIAPFTTPTPQYDAILPLTSGTADGIVFAPQGGPFSPASIVVSSPLGGDIELGLGGIIYGSDARIAILGTVTGPTTFTGSGNIAYDFANFDGPTPEVFTWQDPSLPAGQNQITLNIGAVVPEPSTVMPLGVLLAASCGLLRRRG